MNSINYEDIIDKIEKHFSSITLEELEANLIKAGINEYPAHDKSIYLSYSIATCTFMPVSPMHFKEVQFSDAYNYQLAA